MTRLPLGRFAAVSAFAFALFPLQAQGPGDLWQVSTKMAMPGMNMPAQSSQVCAAKTWTKPPGGERAGCTSSAITMSGNTASWDMVCTGPPTMNGHGEITRSGDAFSGSIKLLAEGVAITIELEGKRVGDCPNPQ